MSILSSSVTTAVKFIFSDHPLVKNSLMEAASSSITLIALSILAKLVHVMIPPVKTPAGENPERYDHLLPAATFFFLMSAAFYSVRTLQSVHSYCQLSQTPSEEVAQAALALMKDTSYLSLWAAASAAGAFAGTFPCLFPRVTISSAHRWLNYFIVDSLGVAAVISLCTYVYANHAQLSFKN